LTLPQKEAAAKLGISESMLCKRFKECTRRKWPYRYVCSSRSHSHSHFHSFSFFPSFIHLFTHSLIHSHHLS
jgi:hypothetical protein